jgi:protein CLEC16A
VLQHQVLLFCLGETFSEQPPIHSPTDLHVNSRANAANFDGSVPKPGLEMNLGAGLVGILTVWEVQRFF